MKEKTSAGPAPRRITSPVGPTCPAAAVPIAPKIPAPMTAPMASMIRSPAPITRLREFSPPSGIRSAMGFLRKSWFIDPRILSYGLHGTYVDLDLATERTDNTDRKPLVPVY